MLSRYVDYSHISLTVVNQIISYITPFPLTVVNLIVIWLSWRKVLPCLSRTFAINITIPSFGYNLYLIMLNILGVLKMDEHFGFRSGNDTIFLDYVTDFVLYYFTYAYRTLAILIILLTYLSFTRPTVYQRVNNTREMIMMFAGSHSLALLCSLAATAAPNRASQKYLSKEGYDADSTPISPFEVVTGLVDSLTFVVLVALYITSIKAIISFKRRNAKLGISSAAKQRRLQALLYATLVFITPPSIFLIPNSVCINLTFVVFTNPVPVLDQICEVKIEMFATLLSMRLLLASSMLLVAFGDYRRALVNYKTVKKRPTGKVVDIGVVVLAIVSAIFVSIVVMQIVHKTVVITIACMWTACFTVVIFMRMHKNAKKVPCDLLENYDYTCDRELDKERRMALQKEKEQQRMNRN
ncbi:hypothetical protein QR680_006091 [Steinernema hermaphroditum]|uniref:Uncharacterized protein n=1 Tax=Steinernema hermaphroditum TaxID=289476 RepID=A0AA39HVM2_9BILA|nr:hypothetical protein QR680_006091 [Steinernema hermaphroditum]